MGEGAGESPSQMSTLAGLSQALLGSSEYLWCLCLESPLNMQWHDWLSLSPGGLSAEVQRSDPEEGRRAISERHASHSHVRFR